MLCGRNGGFTVSCVMCGRNEGFSFMCDVGGMKLIVFSVMCGRNGGFTVACMMCGGTGTPTVFMCDVRVE